MSEHDNGGAAFPAQPIYRMPSGVETVTNQGGMTLRDYFAATAMQGLVTRTGRHDADLIAHDAYVMADAMLKARQS